MYKAAILLLAMCAVAQAIVLPRHRAPDFKGMTVLGDKFTTKTLSDYHGKYLVLFFYPFDFTFVCPTELIAFSEAMKDFERLEAAVLGASVDSHFTHLAWLKHPRTQGGLGKLNYPLYGDVSKKLSRDYGVLVEDEDDELFGASLRGLFIIDKAGIVR
jgi:alkyl hydroperoxide reductase subunit AhpC